MIQHLNLPLWEKELGRYEFWKKNFRYHRCNQLIWSVLTRRIEWYHFRPDWRSIKRVFWTFKLLASYMESLESRCSIKMKLRYLVAIILQSKTKYLWNRCLAFMWTTFRTGWKMLPAGYVMWKIITSFKIILNDPKWPQLTPVPQIQPVYMKVHDQRNPMIP